MYLLGFYEHLVVMYVPENLPENLFYDATDTSECLYRKNTTHNIGNCREL